jgi:hypothetical protein
MPSIVKYGFPPGAFQYVRAQEEAELISSGVISGPAQFMTEQQKATVYIYLKQLLAKEGSEDKARQYALKHQIILPTDGLPEVTAWLTNVETERAARKEENLRNAAIRDAEEAKRSQAYAETEVLTIPLEPVTDFDGWPNETEAEVYAQCRNPRMVVVRLADGRTASMWKGYRRRWPIGVKTKVKLSDPVPDQPIYEPVYEEGA